MESSRRCAAALPCQASGSICALTESRGERGSMPCMPLPAYPTLDLLASPRLPAVYRFRCYSQGTKINSKGKEVPHGTRLYSIAASRYGDTFDGKTTSLCVRRAEYWCPEMKANDPAKKGLCSNFLCDAKPGDEITMTGADRLRAAASFSHRQLQCCIRYETLL